MARMWDAIDIYTYRHGRFREINAAGGQQSAVGQRSAVNWFWEPFHLDCIYGEHAETQVIEVDNE
jgi:hypothetical protein